MDNFEFQRIALNTPISFDFECLDAIIDKSTGEPVMLNTDVKEAILHLRGMALDQYKLICMIGDELEELKNKKSFIRRLFKK